MRYGPFRPLWGRMLGGVLLTALAIPFGMLLWLGRTVGGDPSLSMVLTLVVTAVGSVICGLWLAASGWRHRAAVDLCIDGPELSLQGYAPEGVIEESVDLAAIKDVCVQWMRDDSFWKRLRQSPRVGRLVLILTDGRRHPVMVDFMHDTERHIESERELRGLLHLPERQPSPRGNARS